MGKEMPGQQGAPRAQGPLVAVGGEAQTRAVGDRVIVQGVWMELIVGLGCDDQKLSRRAAHAYDTLRQLFSERR